MKVNSALILILMLMMGCRPELDAPRIESGEADFSRFVAAGSSQMAGYFDGALTREGQESSIAAILSDRFSLINDIEFKQPLVNPGFGYGVKIVVVNGVSQFQYSGKVQLTNRVNCLNQADYGTVSTPHNPADRNWIGPDGPYHNLAVPNIKSFQLYSQQLGRSGTSGNPYYARFASDTGATTGLSSTILSEAALLNPTFFALWIGNNDVFAYGFNGGAGLTSGLGPYDITPEDTFYNAIVKTVNSLTGNQAEGVIGNLPDLTSLPYFTVIPYNGLVLTQSQAAQMDSAVQQNSGIDFNEGNNGYIYSSGAGIKQLGPGELVLLSVPMDSLRCGQWGTPMKPLAAEYVLDSAEVSIIRSKINVFNSSLRIVAAQKNLAFADLNSFYKTLQPGIVFNGNTFTVDHLTGGAFSVDGIYPNPRGYALIANVFIDAINARYKSSIPHADVNAYAGIDFP